MNMLMRVDQNGGRCSQEGTSTDYRFILYTARFAYPHLTLLSCLLIAPLTGDRFNGLRRGAERERGTYVRPQRMAHSSWPYAIHSQHVAARSQRATVHASSLLLGFMMLL